MKNTLRILIVEDDKYFLLHLREITEQFGLIETAQNWPEAEQLLKNGHYDLVITDLNLPGGPQGLRVLAEAKKQNAMRLVLTASDEQELIAKAYEQGAQHVLSKNKVRETLPAFIRSLLTQNDQQKLNQIFTERFPTKDKNLSNEITKLLTVAWQGRALLITGPTGTGKSVLGKLLAEYLVGTAAPFIHLNCSELTEHLLESELFGHEKGAFTGADAKREGKLKAADGGVLFLDEIGTMSSAMQQKLLKAIEEKSFYPIGSNKLEKSSFTLISATCEDLQLKIKQGQFREDLYFRIAGLRLHLPALASRKQDIESFIRLFQEQIPRRFVLAPAAIEQLKNHSWPGNLRELRQVILQVADQSTGVVNSINFLNPSAPQASGLINQEVKDFIQTHGLRAYFQEVEKIVAQESLTRHQGKITSCIKELKISSSAFYRILQEHKLSL